VILRPLERILFGLSPTDTVNIVSAVPIIILVLASGRRAARIDPAQVPTGGLEPVDVARGANLRRAAAGKPEA
jgi:hypothetical protein